MLLLLNNQCVNSISDYFFVVLSVTLTICVYFSANKAQTQQKQVA